MSKTSITNNQKKIQFTPIGEDPRPKTPATQMTTNGSTMVDIDDAHQIQTMPTSSSSKEDDTEMEDTSQSMNDEDPKVLTEPKKVADEPRSIASAIQMTTHENAMVDTEDLPSKEMTSSPKKDDTPTIQHPSPQKLVPGFFSGVIYFPPEALTQIQSSHSPQAFSGLSLFASENLPKPLDPKLESYSTNKPSS